jgi:DnaJ-class molecular chaperone
MATEEMKDCPRCQGRGRYADPGRDPLVRVNCERCHGSGRVPADSPDEPPAEQPGKVPFGTRR